MYPVLTGECYATAEQAYEKKFNEYNTLLDKRSADEQKLKDEMAAKQKTYVEEQKKLSADLLKEQIRMQRATEAQYANQSQNFGLQNKVRRIFEVNRFGIYNSDCARSMPKGPVISLQYYSVDEKINLDPTTVYLIDMGSNIVYDMSNNSYSFMYDTRKKYSLCIVAGGNLYVCPNKEFESTVKDSRKFSFTTVNAEDVEQFRKALQI